jgi:hypothetical protein
MAYTPNLKWTVGDIERRNFAALHPNKSFDEVFMMLERGPYRCTRERLLEVVRHFRVRLLDMGKSA